MERQDINAISNFVLQQSWATFPGHTGQETDGHDFLNLVMGEEEIGKVVYFAGFSLHGEQWPDTRLLCRKTRPQCRVT